MASVVAVFYCEFLLCGLRDAGMAPVFGSQGLGGGGCTTSEHPACWTLSPKKKNRHGDGAYGFAVVTDDSHWTDNLAVDQLIIMLAGIFHQYPVGFCRSNLTNKRGKTQPTWTAAVFKDSNPEPGDGRYRAGIARSDPLGPGTARGLVSSHLIVI